MDKHPNYLKGEEAPLLPEEVPYVSPWDQETPVESEKHLEAKLSKLIDKKASSPVSAQKNATPDAVAGPVLQASVNEVAKSRGKGKSSPEYKKAWRAKNHDHYLQKNREYVRAYRLRQSGKGGKS